MSTSGGAVTEVVNEPAISPGIFGAETSPLQLDLLRDPDGRLPADVFQQVRRHGRGRPPGAKNKRTRKIAQAICQQFGDPALELASVAFMPLDQMVEAMIAATGHSAMEAKLIQLVDITISRVTQLSAESSPEARKDLQELVDSVLDASRRFTTKPGDLAESALKIKVAALKEVVPYVYGKMPVQTDDTGRPDVILNIPGLTDPSHLAEMTGANGLNPDALERLDRAAFLTGPEGGDVG